VGGGAVAPSFGGAAAGRLRDCRPAAWRFRSA